MYSSFSDSNITRNYNDAQGMTHPSDASTQILRDISLRHISIQNSGKRPIAIAITSYLEGPTPTPLATLVGGEIKHMGINSHGGPPQYIWILNNETGEQVGTTTLIRSDAQDLVLRDGVNKWWVQFFKRPSFSPAH